MTMNETMVNTRVTYVLEHAGEFFIIEQVPARVCMETGEQFFAPETVDHIQSVVRKRRKPSKIIQTPVYQYA